MDLNKAVSLLGCCPAMEQEEEHEQILGSVYDHRFYDNGKHFMQGEEG